MDKEKKEIAKEYQEFCKMAEDLAKQDLAEYPLEGHESPRTRFERHLLGMLEMYSIRYGYSEEAINYRCAWKALKASILATPGKEWKGRELFDHLTLLEIDCKIETFGELLKTIKEGKEGE